MRKSLLFFLLFFLITLPALLFAARREGEMKIKIENVSPQTLRMLDRTGFIFDEYYPTDLFLLVTPDELERLKKMGFEPEIVIPDMQAYRQAIMSQPDYAQYHDYYATLTLVDSLVNEFPNLIQKVNYGSSLSGRELYAVKISDNVTFNEDEPEISFDGCHHGDEIMGSEVIVLLMRDLCVDYGVDPFITGLV
ncbi:MAG: M14 family zinc carboxypeptidase, partial [Calditrichia bacterium]